MKLLVIDDELAVRRSLAMIASLQGWETVSCDQFTDIIQVIREEKVDVIFCDFRMPPVTGLQVVQQIRAAGLLVPVVMISANPPQLHASAFEELGISRILLKPPSLNEVRSALAAAAAQAQHCV